MNEHTPGPWRIETLSDCKKFNLPRGPIHQVLATVKGCPSTVCTVEEYEEVPDFDANRLADARLIAAAPDLLQELINIASAKPSTWEDPSEFKAWAQSRAQAAIAKATGAMP